VGHWITKNGQRIYINGNGKKKGEAIAVAVLLASALVSSGGAALSAATASGGAVESVIGQSIQTRITSSSNAARRGQYREAWRRMGLRAISREIRRELQCAVHSYGQVQQFFLRTSCRSLQRALLVIGDADGDTAVVSIAWVRMHNASRAARLQQLVDTDGTGNISPIASAVLEARGVQFTGEHYASRRTGSLVVIAEAAPNTGQLEAEVLDAAAQVAVVFPSP
jgi:hypothetical protein